MKRAPRLYTQGWADMYDSDSEDRYFAFTALSLVFHSPTHGEVRTTRVETNMLWLAHGQFEAAYYALEDQPFVGVIKFLPQKSWPKNRTSVRESELFESRTSIQNLVPHYFGHCFLMKIPGTKFW